ncbi:MerR family DNA-binding transcriptional regulator [Streptomyces sp. Y1]|uniref:MerR family DNA-binding transcriptional regulator n=1 Tax=Streptomyces sp. Y1 TaxID=3238634 RepID=A0AB39THP3_9ACTN
MDLSIGEVAQRSGLSVHALRFYEREGLFANPVRRLANGRRVYHEEHLARGEADRLWNPSHAEAEPGPEQACR